MRVGDVRLPLLTASSNLQEVSSTSGFLWSLLYKALDELGVGITGGHWLKAVSQACKGTQEQSMRLSTVLTTVCLL
jgi:hypothetical protein